LLYPRRHRQSGDGVAGRGGRSALSGHETSLVVRTKGTHTAIDFMRMICNSASASLRPDDKGMRDVEKNFGLACLLEEQF
jgi:hypothetical protein